MCKLCCCVVCTSFINLQTLFFQFFFSFHFIKVEAYQISSPGLGTTIFYNIDNITTLHPLLTIQLSNWFLSPASQTILTSPASSLMTLLMRLKYLLLLQCCSICSIIISCMMHFYSIISQLCSPTTDLITESSIQTSLQMFTGKETINWAI